MDKSKILIVDDEDDVRSTLAGFLKRNIECEVLDASDGRKALELIKKQAFDIILLDIKMPGVSGIDVLEKTKKLHPDAEVLIITAYDSKQVAHQALKSGATDYIPKPFSLKVIRTKVCEILKKKDKYLPKHPKRSAS